MWIFFKLRCWIQGDIFQSENLCVKICKIFKNIFLTFFYILAPPLPSMYLSLPRTLYLTILQYIFNYLITSWKLAFSPPPLISPPHESKLYFSRKINVVNKVFINKHKHIYKINIQSLGNHLWFGACLPLVFMFLLYYLFSELPINIPLNNSINSDLSIDNLPSLSFSFVFRFHDIYN